MKTNIFRNHCPLLLCGLLLLAGGCKPEAEETDDSNGGNAAKQVLAVAPTSLQASGAGGNYGVAVTSNVAWTAAVNDANAWWCTVSPASGSGNGTLTVNVAENPLFEARVATVTLTAGALTLAVAVIQAAGENQPGDAILSVDNTAINAVAAGGNYGVAVTSNVAWTAAVNDANAWWCTVSPASGSGNGTLTVNVAENPLFEARVATVTLTAGALTLAVAVIQAATDYVPSVACDIESFTVNGTAWDISGTNITYTYPPETNESQWLTPVITVSAGATVTPASGAAQDFFTGEGVAYTVTAEDGVTTKTYTAKALIQAQAAVASGITGDCSWTLTGTSGNYTLTISGAGAMENYGTNDLSQPWSSYREDIKTLVIQDGVTTIGNGAFWNCLGLTAVTIPNSVTTIGGWAFAECTGLTSVTIPNSVTTIGNYAFSGCYGLTGALTIPNSVITIGQSAFWGCYDLTAVVIGNSVETIGNYAFEDCVGLTAVTIPNSVTTISNGAFRECTGLTAVTIPNSVITIGDQAFYGCTGLTAVTIPNSVETIGESAFRDCYNLTDVVIGNSVTTIGPDAFRDCYNLTAVTLGSSVTTIDRRAFYNCTALTSVTNHSTTPQSINIEVFNNVNLNTCTLWVPASAVSAYEAANVWRNFGTITGI